MTYLIVREQSCPLCRRTAHGQVSITDDVMNDHDLLMTAVQMLNEHLEDKIEDCECGDD